MSRCYAYIVAYISRLEIGNVVLRPARLEVGHYDIGRLHNFLAHLGTFSSKLPCFRPQMSPYSGVMHSRAPPRLRNIVSHARTRRAPLGVWLQRRAGRHTGLKWAKWAHSQNRPGG